MGIQGLLPFLKPSTKQVNIKEFSGCTVAVDSYCWLHKGAFSCAERLAKGEETDQYVTYCMKYINMLISYNIKPILVFDGRHLPAKAETEKARRQKREENRRKAAELLRLDRANEARTLIQRCVDITPEMASNLIKKCHSIGVDCIVAPYEADSQLAYLNINNIAQIIITEDSDLLLFGCKMVLFKMDVLGNGLLVEQDKIPIAMKQRPEQFTMDKFRHMCILSGCDYLQSLPGIGLQKAFKFIKRTAQNDMSKALTRLGAYLNMSNLIVSPDYKEKFLYADSMFKYQPVFDPKTRKVVPLTPLPEGIEPPIPNQLPDDTAYQIALGNLNPFSLEKLDNFNPDTQNSVKTNSWKASANIKNSIWSRDYQPSEIPLKKDIRIVERPTTQKKTVVQNVDNLMNKIPFMTQKDPEEELNNLREMYGHLSPPKKKSCLEINDLDTTFIEDSDECVDNSISSSTHRSNPFLKKSNVDKTPRSGLAKMSKLVNKTTIDDSVVVRSRFFGSCSQKPNQSHINILSVENCPSSQEDEILDEILQEAITSPKKDKSLNIFTPEKSNMLKQKLNETMPSPIKEDPRRNIFKTNINENDLLEQIFNDTETSPKIPPKNIFTPEKSNDMLKQILNETMPSPIIEDPKTKRNVFKTSKNEDDSDILGQILCDVETNPKTPEKNIFASPKKIVNNDIYNDFQCKSERPSFLNVIHSMSKCVSEKTEHKSNFKWADKKQSTMSTFVKSDVKTPKVSQKAKTNLQPARNVGLKRKKSNDPDQNQRSLLSMFAFQPKVKLKDV